MTQQAQDYKISHELPPIYDKCVEKWGVSFDNTAFTYGNVIHIKGGISDNLLAHELVHVKQQTEMGAELWWDKYLSDDKFRLSQEVEAYQAQYKDIMGFIRDRNMLARFLMGYAEALSGNMYGNLVTRGEAIKLITK